MTSNELHWVAGYLEGEGSFGTVNKHNKHAPTRVYPLIQVSSTDRDVLDRLVAIVGFGSVYGPRPVKKDNHTPIYVCQLRHYKKVLALMEKLYPLMSERRQQRIEEVVAIYESSLV